MKSNNKLIKQNKTQHKTKKQTNKTKHPFRMHWFKLQAKK